MKELINGKKKLLNMVLIKFQLKRALLVNVMNQTLVTQVPLKQND